MKLFKNIALILLSLAGFGSLTSCEKIHTGNGTIVPVVKGVSEGATKSGPVTTTESIKSIGFVMDAYATENYIDHTSNTPQKYAGRYFTESVNYSGNWAMEHEQYWINDVPLRFWCWDRNAEDSGLSMKLYDYSESTRGFLYAMPSDPNKRRDIVMCYASKTWDEGSGDEIDLTFYHPLTSLQFEFSVPSGVTLTKVAAIGLKTEGAFDMHGDAGSIDSRFIWDAELVDSRPVQRVEESLGPSATGINFYVVPQKIVEGVTGLELTLQPDGKDAYAVRVIFSNSWTGSSTDHKEWKASYYYKYRLSVNNAPTDPIGFDISVTLDDWGNMDYNNDGNITDEDKITLTPNQ